jgi:indole-3-glycerol phosphate synthase
LESEEIKLLSALAKSLGMEVLMEIHGEEELQNNLHETVDIIGVNNRNLKTFITDIETSVVLSEKIPDSYIKISESGINNPDSIIRLQKFGFKGFLMGEHFMQNSRPEKGCAEFIAKLKERKKEDKND